MISDPSTSSAANVNGSSHKGFDAQSFLHILRHKTLAVIGDDVALELFLALDADLQPLASPDSSRLRPTRGNAVTASKNEETAHLQGRTGKEAAICYFTSRYYPTFNATVALCNCGGSRFSAALNATRDRDKTANTVKTIWSQCFRRDELPGSNKSSTSQVGVSQPQDFIVIAFGPFYRPPFTADDRHSYMVRLNDSVNAFKADMAGLRRQIRLHDSANHGRSHSKVIWSLLPHMGVLETETPETEMTIEETTMSGGQKNDTIKGTTSIGEKFWMKFL
jgi:hypothetical protein